MPPREAYAQNACSPFLIPSPTVTLAMSLTPEPQGLGHSMCSVSVTGRQAHQHIGRWGKPTMEASCPQQNVLLTAS